MRHPKSYENQLTKVRALGPAQSALFNTKSPWGLARAIYHMLKEWNLSEYYDVKVDKTAGRVIVRNTVPMFKFIDEEEFDLGGRYGHMHHL